jgi:uncharacterized protein (DUF779 family)
VPVRATAAALEIIDRLVQRHGPVVFFQSGGCCDGSSAMCLLAEELPAGPADVLLGSIGGASFYIDGDQYERWNRPAFVIDVADGPADGFSLEGGEGVHFVSRS